ncbi:MAG: M14 family zinc carboxypeptidase [Polyangiaceae bacterium]
MKRWLCLLALAACDPHQGASSTQSHDPLPPHSAIPSTSSAPAPPNPAPCAEPPPSGEPHTTPHPSDLDPTADSLRDALEALARAHPCAARLHTLGKSHLGRPLLALELGRGESEGKPTILLDGAHHGDEPLSATFVLDAARFILSRAGRDPEVDGWLDELRVWLVPLVNPDGLEAYVQKTFARSGIKKPGRKNARDNDGDGRHGPNDGVDLNRNYPFKWGYLGEEGSTAAYALHTYRGPSAGSEPETQAMIALAEHEVFSASISYHIGGIAMLVPYTIERVRDPKPNPLWPIARGLAAAMTPHPDAVAVPPYPVKRKLYSVDGTDQDYLFHGYGTLALLVEGALRGSAGAADRERRARVVEAQRSSWLALLRRVMRGPQLEGRVVDRQGHPLVAEVSLVGTETFEGEHWRTRCRDGAFTRWVAEPGPQALRVQYRGTTIERRVTAGPGRTRVTIELEVDAPPASCPPLP